MSIQIRTSPSIAVRPQTEIKVFNTVMVRTLVVQCTMIAFGATPEEVSSACQGFSENVFVGLLIEGVNTLGKLEDRARLTFDALTDNVNLSIDMRNGKSIVETFSGPLAKAIEQSVSAMRRRGLRVVIRYTLADHINANPEARAHVLKRFNLVDTPLAQPADGQHMLDMFSVRPGQDKGIHFLHQSAFTRR